MRYCRHRFRVWFYFVATNILVVCLIITLPQKSTFLTFSTPSDTLHNLAINHVRQHDGSLKMPRPSLNTEGRFESEQESKDFFGQEASDPRETHNTQDESQRLYQLQNSGDPSPPELTNVNCAEVIHNLTVGDGVQMSSQHSLTSGGEEERSAQSMGQLWERSESCTHYVLSSGFLFARVSEEELSFPVAFSILVYKDLEQVERLLRAVYRPHNLYCLHTDRKAPRKLVNGVRHLAACLPNVLVARHPVSVNWGTISVLEPEIQCMRDLLYRGADWRYFINLTGQEFPLKTNRELVQILGALKGANIITGSRDKNFDFRWRNPKPVPYNLTMAKGDVHIIASRQYVDYVINSRVARELFEWLRDSFIPDESFFSTLNYNPQLGIPGSFTGPVGQMTSQSFRSLKLWQYDPEAKCHGRWQRYICHFGVGDLPALTSSSSLIANKLTYGFHPVAYDCLEQWYFAKVRQENAGTSPIHLDMAIYEQSPFVKFRYTGPVLMWG